MDKKTQAPPPISPEENNMLLDRLEEQGLVYLDDKTAVFCLNELPEDLDSPFTVDLHDHLDHEAMWKLGIIEDPHGYTRDDVSVLIIKRISGNSYDLGEYSCSNYYSMYGDIEELGDDMLRNKPMDEIRKNLEKVIVERAGGLTPEIVESLRTMGTGLDDFAEREREDMDISHGASDDEEPEEKWSNTPFANFSLDVR